MSTEIKQIPKEKFKFVQLDTSLHDVKFETKPVGYFKDAWLRFKRNKGSVVAACIILILLLYAIIVPFFSPYNTTFRDSYYHCTKPKSKFFSKFGFWDGTYKMTVNQQGYDYWAAITAPDKDGNIRSAIVKVLDKYEKTNAGRTNTYYDIILDSYLKVGYEYRFVTKEEYNNMLKYQEETGIQLLYPMVDTKKILVQGDANDANYWFEYDLKGRATRDANGNYIDIFLRDENGDYVYYVEKMGGNQYQIRVFYYDYFVYVHGREPCFLFGTDGYGQDIFSCLAVGARLSFVLSICVAIINFTIGTIYGAIEGYYGGWIDIILERISDILSGVPFIVTASLFQMHLASKVGVIGSLLFAFVLTGWLGTAYRVRTQFYRFKGQEYILAARTLGAGDSRLIFRHILPNSIGTIVTSSVLMIPGVIFTESSLSYLNIINLQSSTMTSVGTLLSNGQKYLSSDPHVIFFPAMFISLLMISFNIFGNGLRDAFNPSLRGAEE
ncbi:MAG: ABC transporter permease [Eubacteriales bacterium]|jgi:oligopeptide transport system permease protein